MARMSNKFTEGEMARAGLIIATAVIKAGCADKVRVRVQDVREECKSLAAQTGSRIEQMDGVFSCVYSLLASVESESSSEAKE